MLSTKLSSLLWPIPGCWILAPSRDSHSHPLSPFQELSSNNPPQGPGVVGEEP